jgi:hypothetical protein
VRKFYMLIIASLVITFVLWSKNPIDDTMNFILGGTIPGTKTALGFWPMIGMITILIRLLVRFIGNLKLQMLEHTAKQIMTEKARDEFTENYSTKDPALQQAILGQSELTIKGS